MAPVNSNQNGSRSSSGVHSRQPSSIMSTASSTRPAHVRPATAMGGPTYSSRQPSSQTPVPAMPPVARPSASRSQSSQLSPLAPMYVPQAPPQGPGSTPSTPTTATMQGQLQAAPPAGPPPTSCCAIGYEISNLSILTYMQLHNEGSIGTGSPATLYERFLQRVTSVLNMPLMIVLPQHGNPLLCVMVFCDQPTDLYDLMHFPVSPEFAKIRQTHQIPVQGHLRKMYHPKARILGPDVMDGTGQMLWK